MAEHNNQVKREDLGNVKKILEEFEGKMNTEVRRQEKLNMAKEQDFIYSKNVVQVGQWKI